jgi:hypothetical protein
MADKDPALDPAELNHREPPLFEMVHSPLHCGRLDRIFERLVERNRLAKVTFQIFCRCNTSRPCSIPLFSTP